MTELFREAGFAVVELEDQPQVVVINTCAVTAVAEGKSRRLIRRTVRQHPESVVAVMGCFSQIALEEARKLGACVVVGTRGRRSLLVGVEQALARGCAGAGVFPPDRVDEGGEVFEELPQLKQEKRVRATVKIQDGCDQRCSYCIVPTVRGPSRSRHPERVLGELESLVRGGYKEIVLTGIHLGCYGRDLGCSLSELIERIAAVPGLRRLRLSSLESVEMLGGGRLRLLDVLAAHKDIICPHFHIPLQSGSDRILARMGRPYSRGDYLEVLAEVRRLFPEAAVTTDIMAGFPGESGEDAEESLRMIEDCSFADVHVFGFSPRPGTPAAVMPEQVGDTLKSARVKALIEAGRKSRVTYLKGFFGQRMEVLLEHVSKEGAQGHTRNYIDVSIPPERCLAGWQSGMLVEVLLCEDVLQKQWDVCL